MNLLEWLPVEQIETINRHVDVMVQDGIRQALTSILPPPAFKTRREYMGQINIRKFHQDMIHYFTVQFRLVILPDVFPDGIPTEFEPTVRIRDDIFYAGVSITFRHLFVKKVLVQLHTTLQDNWENPTMDLTF